MISAAIAQMTDFSRVIEHLLKGTNDTVHISSLLQEPERFTECQFTDDIKCVCSISAGGFVETSLVTHSTAARERYRTLSSAPQIHRVC